MYKKLFLAVALLTTNSLLAQKSKVDPNEFNSLVETCMDLQVEGKLPGVSSDIDPDAIFKSDSISISTKNLNYYPLKSNCIINNKQKEYSFTFIKNSHTSDWVLAQK